MAMKTITKYVDLTGRKKGWPRLQAGIPHTRYVTRNGVRFLAFQTKPSDGQPVVWDTCGQCVKPAKRCVCKDGVHAPRSVRHFLELANDIPGKSNSSILDTVTVTVGTGAIVDEKDIPPARRAVRRHQTAPTSSTVRVKMHRDKKPRPQPPMSSTATSGTRTDVPAVPSMADVDQAVEGVSKNFSQEIVDRILKGKK